MPRRIRQLSNDVLLVQQGSLYPALQRLEHQGWIKAKWGVSEQNRRAKFYQLTRAGRRQLEREAASWERLAAAVTLVVRTAARATSGEPVCASSQMLPLRLRALVRDETPSIAS